LLPAPLPRLYAFVFLLLEHVGLLGACALGLLGLGHLGLEVVVVGVGFGGGGVCWFGR